MSATSGSPRGPSAGRPQARRKSKPKFEIPVEAATPASAGWVDRAPDSPASASVAAEARVERPAASGPAPEPGGFSAAGSALMVFGLATMGRAVWLGFNIFTAPIRFARHLLVPD